MRKRQREERKEELKEWMAGKRTWNKEHPVEAMEKRLQNLLDREVRHGKLWQREELRKEKKEIKKQLRLQRKAEKKAKTELSGKKPKRGFFRWLKDRYDHLIKTKLRAGR